MNIYDFKVKSQSGEMVDLSEYKGKVLLVVNTATGCGFTPQYKDLQAIYDELNSSGFEILDFPCNQFRDQASGTDEEIHSFCTLNYGTTFPQFSKVDVNGENADPLFKWITENTKFAGFSGPMKLPMSAMAKKADNDYKNNGNIKWNFTKILIDRNGNIVERFEPTTSVKKVKESIHKIL